MFAGNERPKHTAVRGKQLILLQTFAKSWGTFTKLLAV
jgi:hypothetical protein